MKKRLRRLSPIEARSIGLTPKKQYKDGTSPKYLLTDEQFEEVQKNKYGGIIESSQRAKIDTAAIKHMWIVVKNEEGKKEGNLFVKNPLYVEPEAKNIMDIVEQSIDNVMSRFKNLVPMQPVPKVFTQKAIKVTTSDDHVGLEPNPKNNGLFKYEYNAEIYAQSCEKLFQSIIKEHNTHGTFDLLLLDNLGDQEDGWNALTTRGGHSLDQNMTNAEVFETVLDVKIKLITSLVNAGIANKIILRKVANDNHSGDFGHIINLAVKKMMKVLYSEDIVEVDTLTRFLEHRFYGDHCFILTHGKDKEKMNRGLPLKLDDPTIKFISDYIRFYEIKSKYIHVEKGDLHQIGYNRCSAFDYRNFMSFAPPSSWVQHNFGDSYSGYSIQVIPKYSNEISHTDYFLDYKKIN